MRPQPRKRIETNAEQSARPGLNNAFGSLEIAGLPDGPPQKPAPEPAPTAAPAPLWKMGRAVLRRETAHRGGKVVTIVEGFATHLPDSILEKLAKRLRSSCGCGGTFRDRIIEIQGDQVPKLRELLEAEGFKVAGVR